MKFYKNNVSPLELVEFEDMKEGELYIWSNGMRIKVVDENTFEMDKGSALVEGENVEDLTPKQLELFWKLMK